MMTTPPTVFKSSMSKIGLYDDYDDMMTIPPTVLKTSRS